MAMTAVVRIEEMENASEEASCKLKSEYKYPKVRSTIKMVTNNIIEIFSTCFKREIRFMVICILGFYSCK